MVFLPWHCHILVPTFHFAVIFTPTPGTFEATNVAQGLKLVSAEMGKHLISTTFAGLLVILSSPGFASGTTKPESEQTTQAPVAVQRVAVPSRGLRDEATMVLIGTALIGLAAAVRRVA